MTNRRIFLKKSVLATLGTGFVASMPLTARSELSSCETSVHGITGDPENEKPVSISPEDIASARKIRRAHGKSLTGSSKQSKNKERR